MKIRAGEEVKGWFRVDRFYHTNEGWWFQTREKLELGPYETPLAAQQGAELYIKRKLLVEQGSTISRLAKLKATS